MNVDVVTPSIVLVWYVMELAGKLPKNTVIVKCIPVFEGPPGPVAPVALVALVEPQLHQ